VYNPLSGELFQAVKGKGARLNGEPIRVSMQGALSDALLVTGFPYNSSRMLRPLMTRFETFIALSQGVRRLGSAALDLCYVACGRFDGFWEQNLKPWDTAAGTVVVREAGGVVTDFNTQPYTVDMKEILATNGRIHEEMISRMPVSGEGR
jgi:myo-inositol-1(or 4)-monophosphatase